ncbi:MAG TPA: solute carrier family 23 protein [Methanotrichaceae archaeon]|nr:solute carrier family 23 protein [Methanotrichaceae archaeon]HQF16654.1 solute carrier family 23 protein [Methanotrichaceae archaeon]HQI91334.1 solute carrier family 23 protein [Methanotrichaceae archaeon]HQJ28748.1 solute carrier family 23 protein [Methanotrichaceae archaeon]
MARKPSNLIYGIEDQPSLATTLILGLQHIFILSIAFIFPVVIVGEIGGTPNDAQNLICMAMLATGFATMIQSVNRGPIGSGYLCPLVNGPAFVPASLLAGKAGGLALIFGMTAFAGLFEVLFSRLVPRMRKFFPPEVTGTVVLMVGVEVIPIAIPKFFGVDQAHPAIHPLSLLVAVITLMAMAAFNVWGRGKLRLYSLLIGMAIGYAVSFGCGLLSMENIEVITSSPPFRVPQVGRFGISFDLALAMPFLVAALSSALKTMGDLTTCQKINDADWKRIDMISISKGLLACGAGNIASGLLGALGQSVSSSNIGLAIATGATSRRIGYAAGGLLMLLAFFPQLAAIFVIMPTPVMGASLIFAVCFMILAGIQIITSRMIDARKTFVIGFSMIFGLSFDFIPGLYAGLPPTWSSLFSSSLAVATICAVSLNLLFRLGVSKRAKLQLQPGVDSSQAIFEFMEKQGGAWGARKEVIYNAIAALNEMLEAAEIIGIKDKVEVDVQFDEFNLDARASYRGEPFEIPRMPPASMAEDRTAPLHLAAYMIGRYADRVAFSSKDGMTELLLHFDH